MKGLEVVRHILGGVGEQIVEVMLITYEVWFLFSTSHCDRVNIFKKKSNVFLWRKGETNNKKQLL